MCVLEECPRTTEDCRRAAQRIEEELSLAEEEVAFVSVSGTRFFCFARWFNDVFCYTHGQVAETTLSVFDLEGGSVISRE
jgi:hypothetical protein